MRRTILSLGVIAAVAAFLSAAAPTHAQTVPVTTVVTVLGPKYKAPSALGIDDISVFEKKEKQKVTSWVPAQGDKAALELAIIIDDMDAADLGLQFNDIANFIKAQPKSAGIGIFYARNGTVQAASQFSADHDAVAKSLRLPLGRSAAYSSIYLSVMDLIKNWPITGARREILLLADGIDRFRGDPFSPDVTATYETAQKASVIIHALFTGGVDRASRNFFRVSQGQSNLAQITDATGGESFFQGTQTPISFAPFLAQLDMVLKNQYWLSWTTNRSKKAKGELRSFRVTTELGNVEIAAPDKIFVPGP
jgi:hypothetical protein